MRLSELLCGAKLADTGVADRIVCFGDGRGNDAELALASVDFRSRADGRRDSEGDLLLGFTFGATGLGFALVVWSPSCRLTSGALVFRTSFSRFDFVVESVTV